MTWQKILGLTLLFGFIAAKVFFDLNPGKGGFAAMVIGAALLIFDEPAEAK